MEEPGAAARGREDHGADAQRLRGAEDALSVAVATEQVTATEVCGAPVARLSIDATQEKGTDFATGLVVPVEAVSASTDGRRFQIGQGNGSSLEQRVEEEKGGSLVPAPQSTAEPGSLQTCHEANDGFSSKTLCALKDTYSMLGETAEGSPFEQEGLVCNGGDWGAEARVIKATVEDLRIAFDEAHLDYAGLSGSMSHGSEQVPRAGSITDATDEVGNGADLGGKVQVQKAEDLRIACDEAQCDDAGVLGLISHGSEQVPRGGSIMDANDEVQQDVLMPDIEAEVSRPAQIDSVPSVSGDVDLSLDGKTGQFGGISGDLMACHVSDRKMCDGLCAAGGKGSQFIDARCMYDTVDMATGGPCQQDILATAAHDNVDLSDPREHHSGKLPCGADALPLITGDNHGLEKVGFLPNVNAVTSGPVDENILSSIDVPLDGQVASVTCEGNLDPATKFAMKNSGPMSADLAGNAPCKTDGASVPPPPPPPPRAAWVCCDDCQKWRCIPAELVDAIGETRWTCMDNEDKAFANCSIPQEKTNAEINAELDLSDVSADEADNSASNSRVAVKAPSWTSIRSNLFLHRHRSTQSIDESMVCNCKPPQDGRLGCRDRCLNRILSIECDKRTCPCGEQCSNQKFQRRSYAKLRWFHSGKKGYGLQLQEDVTEGRFLIEYVGEVLDITSYESRQSYYASKGQKHFYFMALNGGEVIDACSKGNLGRFINHSCSPNCRTEKWMVNGEVCIGIFAMRNIKKGEELTFDYNYVRVSGAAPQKCFCGTTKCRGYIGGDISVLDTVTHADAEEAHFEQLDKDSEELIVTNGSDSDGSHPNITEPEFSIQREDLHDCSAAKADLEPLEQTGGTFVETSEADNSLEAWSLQEDEDVTRTPVHVSQSYEISLQQFPVHDPRSSDLLQKTAKPTEGSKAPNAINGSMPSSDFRNNLVPGFNDKKRNSLTQHKNPKPQLFSIDNEHILGVEGRLNNLLDVNGGISKRKDATNGYLKLLVVTAAEGDNAGGTSKSVRDLSLILDALLKTKSRSVLLDIINKNGLQMLHNMLKQNREKFHRTPIIRKLLKVLEFLAQKGILTSKHIHEGPRFAGVESFRESMLSLVRHRNFQVQQIARSFRDRWILHNSARSEPMEYPHPSTSAQNIQGTNMIWSSARRKRKSRWDYQPDEHYKMVGLKIQKVCSGQGELDVNKKLQRHQGTNNCHNDFHGMQSSTEGADDEVPPGFEPQQQCQPAQLPIGSEVAPGLCMERYQPSLGISYGVPVALVEHFGTPESEGGQCHKKWKVAPGVPFSPFPPLPPYPRGSPCPSTSSSQMFQHDGTSPVNHNGSGHCGRTAARDGRVHRTWRNGPRTKPPYHQQGRRFLSNHHRSERFEPPRPQ
nr:unnamed protein product [Digitaria exilis]